MSEEKKLDEKKLEEVTGGGLTDVLNEMSFFNSWHKLYCCHCAKASAGCTETNNQTVLYQKYKDVSKCPNFVSNGLK